MCTGPFHICDAPSSLFSLSRRRTPFLPSGSTRQCAKWSRRSVRDSGCGLHSGGRADEATGRTGTKNRGVTRTERIGEFGGVAWGGSVVNNRLLIVIIIRALGPSYMVITIQPTCILAVSYAVTAYTSS